MFCLQHFATCDGGQAACTSFMSKQIWNLRENRRNKSYLLNYDLLTRHHSEIKPVLHWFSSNMFRFKPAWKVELGRLMFSSLKGHSSQSPSKRLNAIGNGCVRFNILSHTHMIWSTSFIPSILPSDLKARWPKKASQQLGGMESYMFLPMGSLAPRCIRPRPRNTTPCASPSSGRNPGLKKVGKMPWWCLFLAPWWCHEIDKMPWWCLLLGCI